MFWGWFFFQYAFANEWVVLVNLWLGLAYHTEETSSYTHTGKIQTRSNDVSLHVHQEESGITPIVPFCSFFPSGFIHWSDRYLGNTSCQYCIFGHRGCNKSVSSLEPRAGWTGRRYLIMEEAICQRKNIWKYCILLICQSNNDCCFLKDGSDNVIGCGWDDLAVWTVTIFTVEIRIQKNKKR